MTNNNPQIQANPWRFCLAPMMDWSDRHCRFFWRLMSQHARLYTEMLSTGAIIHGDREHLLSFNQEEQPLALQVGGSNPRDLAETCKIAEDWGYQEVNLNCGCPSDRVQNNKIGACLMAEPDLVAECISVMQNACSLPITIKHRLGIDDLDSWEHLENFVATNVNAGCDVFIVHARKAWLQGLSPKQNREVPPLDYERVNALKQAFPEQTIIINGGIKTIDQCTSLLSKLDGVMMGREAYQNPFVLHNVDSVLFGDSQIADRLSIIDALIPYCEEQVAKGVRLSHVTRHILGLFNGLPGARLFRRHLSENATKPGAKVNILRDAVSFVTEHKPTLVGKLESDPTSSDNASTKDDRGNHE